MGDATHNELCRVNFRVLLCWLPGRGKDRAIFQVYLFPQPGQLVIADKLFVLDSCLGKGRPNFPQHNPYHIRFDIFHNSLLFSCLCSFIYQSDTLLDTLQSFFLFTHHYLLLTCYNTQLFMYIKHKKGFWPVPFHCGFSLLHLNSNRMDALQILSDF